MGIFIEVLSFTTETHQNQPAFHTLSTSLKLYRLSGCQCILQSLCDNQIESISRVLYGHPSISHRLPVHTTSTLVTKACRLVNNTDHINTGYMHALYTGCREN